jgi:hypothetical protein
MQKSQVELAEDRVVFGTAKLPMFSQDVGNAQPPRFDAQYQCYGRKFSLRTTNENELKFTGWMPWPRLSAVDRATTQ